MTTAQQPHIHDGLTCGEEQIHNTCENKDKIHRLQALRQCAAAHLGDADAHKQERCHDGVTQPALTGEQRHNVEDDAQELGAGVKAMDEGISGEKLT